MRVIHLLVFTLVLRLGAVAPAAAQAFYYVPAPEAMAAFAPGPAYVAHVVDARPQRASLGLVVRGGKERAATFHEGMTGTLQAFFRTHAPGSAGAVPLVLRLSGLEIAELPGSFVEGRLSEATMAGLVADFYAPQPDSKLSLLTGEVRLAQSNSAAATAVINRPTHLFIYRPRSEKGPTIRIRLAEGQPAQELAAGAFLSFEPASDQPLQVCLVPTVGPEIRLAITPTSEAPTYLECRPTAAVPLRQVTDTAGAAALNRLVR